ncbi:MTAP family purine nucleoside phosphorylase [Symbiobacterium terraclitae]|uniref:MTAP family purine nucleoside phosphorylase n=1 Tax=Symbiobacterium terraclitae TaxID=557451 RepID=UPI0035B52A52
METVRMGGHWQSESVDTGGHGPVEAVNTGGHGPVEAVNTGGHGPVEAVNTGGHWPAEAVNTGGNGAAEAVSTGGHGPVEAVNTSGHWPAEAVNTGGNGAAEAVNTGGHWPAEAVNTGGHGAVNAAAHVDTVIIGGTAAYHLQFDSGWLERTMETPYGLAGPFRLFEVAGRPVAFLSRHGGEGRLGVTPPFVNYRANVWAARTLGARRILSWNSAGSLVRSLPPGSLAVVSDLIDWTRRRPASFGQAVHPDGDLFDPGLRAELVRAAAACGHRAAPGAVYAATEGARLETRAEIALLAQAGAELVGMTLAPEAFLARELGMAYGSICWVSNYATGVPFDGPEQRLFGPEVGQLMFEIIRRLLEEEAKQDA